MKQITEEQIEAKINSVYPGWRSDGEWTGKAYSYRAGVEYAIEQMQPEWIPLPAQHLLAYGFYWLKLLQPQTLIEDVIVYRIHSGAGIIPYFYATHYCPLPEPPQ